MDKISSILPNNARVKTVDMSESHPIRPGTPEFGRRVGANRLGDRVTLSQQAQKESALLQAKSETLASGRNPREAKNVQIADKLTNDFFMNKLADVQEIKGEPLSEQIDQVGAEIVAQAPQTETQAPPPAAAESKPLSVYA